MDIRLKFLNPVTHDGDLAASIILPEPLEIEDYEDIISVDEYGQELESREMITRPLCNFQIGKERILKVKISPYNKGVIARMVAKGPWEYVDATEAKILNELKDATAAEIEKVNPASNKLKIKSRKR
jgi:hypothetical protein